MLNLLLSLSDYTIERIPDTLAHHMGQVGRDPVRREQREAPSE